MTENKRFNYYELVNGRYSIDEDTFEEIYGEKNTFHHRLCNVDSEKEAKKVVGVLNEQHEQIQELTDALNQRTKQLDVQYETIQVLKKEIERLKLQDEDRKAYQRTLEDKIKRLKNRIKVLE